MKKPLLMLLISFSLAGCNGENDVFQLIGDNKDTGGETEHPDVAINNGSLDRADLTKPIQYFKDWPKVSSLYDTVPESEKANIESRISEILSQMTLEEKLGQMIQPDLREVTPEEAKEYKLGSILNGGGGWPNNNKYSTAEDWAKEADKYWLALEEAYADRGFKIPFMWATDAVHGHNNVFKATVFPHNIGLGAANNPDMIEEIGRATAIEVAATGLDWTFAPTVATPRDYRWGRVYEGYSEDPSIVWAYASRMVQGIQGGAQGLKSDIHVISNVKHWIGDGGTLEGIDHGENRYTEEYLINIHAAGYLSGLTAGAQVVMSSFNSWWNPNNYDPMRDINSSAQDGYEQNQKIHGSQYLIQDVLKDKMGFDGLVVTDWNGQGEINGCTPSDCPQAVIAGNDIFMVTARSDWKAFYENTLQQVKAGIISQERIDDAVTRILRVKMRANLWEKPMPSLRSLAGDSSLLGSQKHTALARQAVSESLVLLKNEAQVLPLAKDSQYLVVGSAANDITKQTGGWSLSWQGDGNTLEEDFPFAQTMLMAMKKEVGEENIFTDISAAPENITAIVVIGEDPYAEMFGDINKSQTLEFSTLKPSYSSDLELIKELKAKGFKVVTVFYSGRPLYVNEEINNSDAFVAAWLPGTEGLGITDVLFAKNNADFKGRLSFSWPNKKCSTTINTPTKNIIGYVTPTDGINGELIEQDINGEHAPLFPYGYGLSYQSPSSIPALVENLNNLSLDSRDYGCGMDEPSTDIAQEPLEIFGKSAKGDFTARMSGDVNGWSAIEISKGETSIGTVTTKGIDYQGMQQSALNVRFSGEVAPFEGKSAAQIYMQTPDEEGQDYTQYINANSTIEFDVRMISGAPSRINLAAHCGYPCLGEVNIATVLPEPSDKWSTVKIPMQCLVDVGMNYQMMNTAFLLYTTEAMEFDLGNIRYVPNGEVLPDDVISCDQLQENIEPALTGNQYDIMTDWNAIIDLSDQYSTDNWAPLPNDVTHMSAINDNGLIFVDYNSQSPESYKGLLHLNFEPKNLTNFVESGFLEFQVLIESFGQQDPEKEVTGLVFKVEGVNGATGDIFAPELARENITLGQWTTVRYPVADIAHSVNNKFFITGVKSLILFPAWGNNQAGFTYNVKNIKFIK
ncbi:glycoside hydrolase family 3 protein [Photobacterium damselae]